MCVRDGDGQNSSQDDLVTKKQVPFGTLVYKYKYNIFLLNVIKYYLFRMKERALEFLLYWETDWVKLQM